MRLARHILAVLFLCLVAAPDAAQAQLTPEPVSGFAGVVHATPELGASRPQPPTTPSAVTVAYDNTASAPNTSLSSTDLAAVWGDRLMLTSTGLLSTNIFTLFNSGASGGGSLLTAQVALDFYDGLSSTFIGGYVVNVSFGAGLPVGFYSLVSVTGIDPFVINLPANTIVLQTVLATTGTANRLGIASLNPVTVGSSPNTVFIQASTIGGGVAAFYSFGTTPVNPGYLIGLAQPPVGTESRTWGELKKLYR